MSFRYSIEASFVLTQRDLFYYIAESGGLVASQESNQASHAECGCKRAFTFIFPLYFDPSNISLFATDIAFSAPMLEKVKAHNINNFLVTENYRSMFFQSLHENLIYSAY